MGLGPPVCLRCMRMMNFHKEPLPSTGHKHWRCIQCGNDALGDDVGNLFGQSDEDLAIILKDHPDLLAILDALRNLNNI